MFFAPSAPAWAAFCWAPAWASALRQVVLGHVDPARRQAVADVLDHLLLVGDLLLQGLLAADGEHRVPGLAGRGGHALPGPFQRAGLVDHLAGAVLHGLGGGFLGQGDSFFLLALLLQGLDLPVDRRGEEVVGLVHLQDRLDRILADVRKRLHQRVGIRDAGLGHRRDRAGHAFDLALGHLAGGSQPGQDVGVAGLGARHHIEAGRHLGQLVGRHAGDVAGQGQGLAVFLALVAALQKGQRQHAGACGRR
jgi:hypothetical protein